ncbi:hypothetical protein HAX54_048269 [Datura stramonium]|uniref:Uncharacterized protein n=1 Tax=Datura stramonium TaxID=4076 RepID=A0ABS8WMW2_DATST|nr:hypothetical protein [Datura stramonium]
MASTRSGASLKKRHPSQQLGLMVCVQERSKSPRVQRFKRAAEEVAVPHMQKCCIATDSFEVLPRVKLAERISSRKFVFIPFSFDYGVELRQGKRKNEQKAHQGSKEHVCHIFAKAQPRLPWSRKEPGSAKLAPRGNTLATIEGLQATPLRLAKDPQTLMGTP